MISRVVQFILILHQQYPTQASEVSILSQTFLNFPATADAFYPFSATSLSVVAKRAACYCDRPDELLSARFSIWLRQLIGQSWFLTGL